MAFWEDAKGDGWLAVPFYGPVSTRFHAPVELSRPARGGVATFRLEQKTGKWELTPAWLSKDIGPGEEAMQANGVLFTYVAGEDVRVTMGDRAFDEPPPRYTGSGNRIAEFDSCNRLRARCRDWKRIVVERRSDHIMESFQRNLRGQWPGLSSDIRRHAVLFWSY